jgi:hypothetical protein
MKKISQIISGFQCAGNSKMVEILNVQQNQLSKWKEILNDKYFNALNKEANKENNKLTANSDPYSVFRGTSMDIFISNTHL